MLHIEDLDQCRGSYVRFNNMLLYRKGLKCQENETISEDTVMVLCEMCNVDLQKSKIPAFLCREQNVDWRRSERINRFDNP